MQRQAGAAGSQREDKSGRQVAFFSFAFQRLFGRKISPAEIKNLILRFSV